MTVIEEIAEERNRQRDAGGRTSEHDDSHECGELAMAAAAYAVTAGPCDQIDLRVGYRQKWQHGGWSTLSSLLWPWERSWWKPTKTRRNLVKAGALIVAEIERLDRAAAKQS
jgi:hypothetical protein